MLVISLLIFHVNLAASIFIGRKFFNFSLVLKIFSFKFCAQTFAITWSMYWDQYGIKFYKDFHFFFGLNVQITGFVSLSLSASMSFTINFSLSTFKLKMFYLCCEAESKHCKYFMWEAAQKKKKFKTQEQNMPIRIPATGRICSDKYMHPGRHVDVMDIGFYRTNCPCDCSIWKTLPFCVLLFNVFYVLWNGCRILFRTIFFTGCAAFLPKILFVWNVFFFFHSASEKNV